MTPRRVAVLAVVPDLFFQSRIRETAKAAGVALEVTSAAEALEACRVVRPDLVILDLTDPADPFALAAALHAEPGLADLPLIGFYPHVMDDLRQRALAAGIEPMPRSAFTARLPSILTGGGA
jgi:CheY-like chemotaxis protein